MERFDKTPHKKRKYDNRLRKLRQRFANVKRAAEAAQDALEKASRRNVREFDPAHPRGGRSKKELRQETRMRTLRRLVPADRRCPECGKLRPFASRAWVVYRFVSVICRSCHSRKNHQRRGEPDE